MTRKDQDKTQDLSRTSGADARKMSNTIMGLTAPKSISQRPTPIPSTPTVQDAESDFFPDDTGGIDVEVEAEDELAKAINNLADKAAASIESAEEREQARDRRDRWLVGISVLSTLIVAVSAFAIYHLVAPVVPAFIAFEKTMGSWEMKAEDSMKLLKESEARQQSMELELANTTEVNRELAASVSALIESQTTTDFVKKQQLAKKAGDKAIVAAGKAAKGIIAKAKRAKKAAPPQALRDYDQLKAKAQRRKIRTEF